MCIKNANYLNIYVQYNYIMESYNPWWVGEIDPLYEEWLNSRVKWIPSIIEKISSKPYALNFLIGPRQVGKTTALKIYIYKLLKKRDPRSIFYYSCDEIVDHRELGEILDNYISMRNAWRIKSSVIILDEITFVGEWHRALKSRIDRGEFRRDVLIITGSASIELLAGKERFPGRRGSGKDLYMYPLSFQDYVRHLTSIELKPSTLENWEEYRKCVEANKVFSHKLEEMFIYYLKTGGFPIPIREYFETGRITYVSYKTYLDWLKTDWLKTGRDEGYMKEVLTYLLEASPTPLSWHNIAKNTSLLSPHTAREYIETLEALMVLKIIYWASPDGKINYRKNKKMLFIDPFIYNVLSKYTRVKVDEATIVEATVTTHFSRRYRTYYWHNSTEIDAILMTDKKPLAFEIKWTRKPRTGRKPIKTYILDREKIPIFLATLKIT